MEKQKQDVQLERKIKEIMDAKNFLLMDWGLFWNFEV